MLERRAKEEIEFWLSNIEFYNGRSIWEQPAAMRVVYSDASDMGYGGFVVEHGPHVANGQWSDVEAKQSSTWRELEVMSRVSSAVVGNLTNCRVKWFSDNQNVVRILQVGSHKPVLQNLALSIFRRLIQYCIRLEPVWLPREENE